MRTVVLVVGAFVATLSLFFALYSWDPVRGPLVWLGLSVPSLIVVAVSQTRGNRYRCPHCGREITLSFLNWFFSQHTITWSKVYLYCPKCDKFGWGEEAKGNLEAPAEPKDT